VAIGSLSGNDNMLRRSADLELRRLPTGRSWTRRRTWLAVFL